MVEYPSKEASLLKKCWSPWKSLVSRCSCSSRPLRSARWLGTFIGEAVVAEWTSLSVSCVDKSLSLMLSFGAKSKRKKTNVVVLSKILQASKLAHSTQEQYVFLTVSL